MINGVRPHMGVLSESCFSYKKLLRNDFTGRPGLSVVKLWKPNQRDVSFMIIVDEKAVRTFDLYKELLSMSVFLGK